MAVPALDKSKPAASQNPRNRGRRARRFFLENKYVVFNYGAYSVKVQSEAKFESINFNPEVDYKFNLPGHLGIVTIYVDAETQSKLSIESIESTAADGYHKRMLMRLRLDRLGVWNRLLAIFGRIPTLYITNVRAPDDEIASPIYIYGEPGT